MILDSLQKVWRDGLASVLILSILFAVYSLEPDTSLEQIRSSGQLSACTPISYPPLVNDLVQEPGIDVELLQALADELGVKLSIKRNSAMGQDFNPRNWRITRAQCQILAGGVVDSSLTRSFLDVIAPHGQTGWSVISKKNLIDLKEKKIAILAGISGLNRLDLSRELRAQSTKVIVAPNLEVFIQLVSSDAVDAGITERLMGQKIASDQGWILNWAPGDLPRYQIAFGLWKGDLTLKRALLAVFDKIQRTGELTTIQSRYFDATQF